MCYVPEQVRPPEKAEVMETTFRKHGVRLFWWPVVAFERRGDRRWIEAFWMRWNLSIMWDA